MPKAIRRLPSKPWADFLEKHYLQLDSPPNILISELEGPPKGRRTAEAVNKIITALEHGLIRFTKFNNSHVSVADSGTQKRQLGGGGGEVGSHKTTLGLRWRRIVRALMRVAKKIDRKLIQCAESEVHFA
jgi:hypothetical protein